MRTYLALSDALLCALLYSPVRSPALFCLRSCALLGSPGARLGSPGARLGSPELSCALLGFPVLTWALLGFPGLSWALPCG